MTWSVTIVIPNNNSNINSNNIVIPNNCTTIIDCLQYTFQMQALAFLSEFHCIQNHSLRNSQVSAQIINPV